MMRILTVRRELSKLDKRYCCYSVTKLHARLPCPSLSPRVCSDSCPLSCWCHPSIHCIFCHPFSPRLQYFPASWSFPTSPLFTSGGQSIATSALASVLPMNIQGWFPLGLTGLISLQSKGLPREFPDTRGCRPGFRQCPQDTFLLGSGDLAILAYLETCGHAPAALRCNVRKLIWQQGREGQLRTNESPSLFPAAPSPIPTRTWSRTAIPTRPGLSWKSFPSSTTP